MSHSRWYIVGLRRSVSQHVRNQQKPNNQPRGANPTETHCSAVPRCDTTPSVCVADANDVGSFAKRSGASEPTRPPTVGGSWVHTYGTQKGGGRFEWSKCHWNDTRMGGARNMRVIGRFQNIIRYSSWMIRVQIWWELKTSVSRCCLSSAMCMVTEIHTRYSHTHNANRE